MQEIKLNVNKREVVGRKVKNLRKEGFIPANIYGKKTKSQAVSINKEDFTKVFSQAGETGVVHLLVKGEKEERPILIQNVQQNPLTDEVLHIDLRQIILTEKIVASIPVILEGESPAVAQKLGILIQPTLEIEVEALPMDLPEKFIVDVSGLTKVGGEIKVSELKIDKKVGLKSEVDLVVAKIEPLAAEEVAPLPPAEEVAVGEEVSKEGEAPETTEKPAEDSKEEEKKE